MNILGTVIISALTMAVMTTFGEIAKFFVNRYLPKITDSVEKKVKKPR